MKRKRKLNSKLVDGKPLEPTSSLNKYCMCVCGKKYLHKVSLIKHHEICTGIPRAEVCHWCNLEFRNRGNLVTHAFYMHGDKSYKKIRKPVEEKPRIKCDVCEETFKERRTLRYHIRKSHFNLWAKVPHAETKLVNQIWYEKVRNTNLIVKIQKTGLNTLVMTPLPPDAGVKVHDKYKRLDLRSLYPFGKSKIDELCKICLKIFRKVDIQKHMNERHLNFTKHKCNNCNQTFKRSYIYLQHVCHKEKFKNVKKKKKPNGVIKHVASSKIRITNVESLNSVVID